MKVTLAVHNKFHIFHLARSLHARNMLQKVFTGYPMFKLRDEGIPEHLIHSTPAFCLLAKALPRLGIRNVRMTRFANWNLAETVSHAAARLLPESDVFFSLTGTGIRAGIEMQKRGGIYVCDRGSTHARFQERILREEFDRLGYTFPEIDPRGINRELEEYEAADIITVPSEVVRRSFIEEGVPAEKVKMIPYGADLRRFAKVDLPAEDRFDVIYVGQIGARKGIDYLVSAFEKVEHPGKHLTLIGSVRPEGQAALDRALAHGATHHPGIPNAELKSHLCKAHVFAIASIEEGLALVQGEAMACGLPIVASEATGGSDLYEEGISGFTVAPRDPDAMAERLQFLADNPDVRQQMSDAALKRVSSLGGWDTYGNGVIAMMEEALVARRSRGRAV